MSPWTVRLWRLKEAAAKLMWQISHWKNCVICMCGTVVSDAMPLEVQLINWIMKSKLVYISLSPSVELCKKKHSFKKLNFKENRQFDTFYMECMAWSAHNFQMSNCNLFESWSQRLCVPSEPLGLKIVRALEQASLRVRKAPLTWASELEMSLCVPS